VKVTFLGTGTSQGIPMIGCKCEVCCSTNVKDNRLRSSIWICVEDLSIIVDTGPDFRYQVMRAEVPTVDAVLFTHSHKDHVAGLDDIKAYNYWQQSSIDIYATIPTQNQLKSEFAYIFADIKYPGIPELNLKTLNGEPFFIHNVKITPIRVMHYKMDVFGFRIGDFTYITDANYISEDELNKIKGTKHLVINALRHEKHISHFTLNEALEIINLIQPENAYLTHISHQLGLHEEINATLPPNVQLAYDGLVLNL
jgi:phosphoribosyl 1,2-cyclic phosphate phosphodiesterase